MIPRDRNSYTTCVARSSDVLRVLTYHRIADANGVSALSNVSASAPEFEKQVLYLVENYNVVSMEQVLSAVRGGSRLPERAVLLTFDDAYRDFAEVAWPILKAHDLPVTLFVPTAFPDGNQMFWWDRLHASIMATSKPEVLSGGRLLRLRSQRERYFAYRTISRRVENMPDADAMSTVAQVCATLDEPRHLTSGVLTWSELRSLAEEGVALGSHTRNHPIMTNVSRARVYEEVAGSRQDLQREIGYVVPIFAYPSGRHNITAVEALRNEGFVLGFTTIDGHNDLRSADTLRLRRCTITPRTTMLIFRLRLWPSFSYADSLRRGFKNRFLEA